MMSSEDAFTGPVNLSAPFECSMLDLAEIVVRATGSQSRIVHAPLPADDPTQRRPDTTLARERLGRGPSVELEDALSRTITYFRGLLGLSRPSES